MAFKKMVERLTKPVEEIDREQLTAFCDARSLAAMDAITAREAGTGGRRGAVGADRPASGCTGAGGHGERRARHHRRGVPRSPQDRRDCRPVAGSSFEGVAARDGKRYLVFNPVYELLA